MSSSSWFAITVKTQYEKVVADALAARGHEAFLPYYVTQRRWSDRIKKIQVPLFAGYVFGRFDWNRRSEVCMIPGYRSIVSFGGKAAPVDPHELDVIRRVVQADGLFEPHPFLRTGQTVRITRGSLAGVEGILTQMTDSFQVVVSVSILQRSVAIKLDSSMVDIVSETVPRMAKVVCMGSGGGSHAAIP
jgi:transcription antitermination factor NusG